MISFGGAVSLLALIASATAGTISNDGKELLVDFETKRSAIEQFVPGDLSVRDAASGLLLSRGLSVRQLAQSGMPVAYTGSGSTSFSNLTFHTQPDAGAVFPLDGGGWVYLSNDEQEKMGRGGVYAVVFDADGEVVSYEQRLGRTTRNCGGGKTPHSTFISCEEYDRGRCYQVDPTGKRKPRVTKLTEPEGGSFESVAVDGRNTSSPVYFITEDNLLGALRRYRPHPSVAKEGGWDVLHGEGGTLDYLEFFPNHTFTWTNDIARGRRSAYLNYPNAEGIDFANGRLYFVSKLYKTLYILDLRENTYEIEFTNEGILLNGTGFADSPDHVVTRGDLIFLTEDGGSNPGLFARNITSGGYFTIMEAWDENVYFDDEACGLAFSPDRRRMYLAFQNAGKLFEITRDDGEPFYGRELLLKSHRIK